MNRPPPISTLFPYTTLFRSLHFSATLNQLRFSRDPVALDVLSLAELDRQRQAADAPPVKLNRSEEHTSELQSQSNLVCRLLLEKKKMHTASDTRLRY